MCALRRAPREAAQKLEQLRKDIEILSQSHERDVDRKYAILQMLDRDLEEAEEQYPTAHRSHLSSVDRLIDIHDARLLALEKVGVHHIPRLVVESATSIPPSALRFPLCGPAPPPRRGAVGSWLRCISW